MASQDPFADDVVLLPHVLLYLLAGLAGLHRRFLPAAVYTLVRPCAKARGMFWAENHQFKKNEVHSNRVSPFPRGWGKVRLEAMSNVFESNSANLRELHSAVKIPYRKCQEGARRRIFDLYPRRHIIEVHSAALSTIVCRGLIQMHTTTNKGLHEFVAEHRLARY